MEIRWQWSSFGALSGAEVYEVLKVRQAVFAVEQNCVYQDVDDVDQSSWHLLGWAQVDNQHALVAYLRVVFPGVKYSEPSIGRVLTVAQVRGQGVGRALTGEALARVVQEYPDQSIRISAQQHLQEFYAEFGFETESEPYDEDGIPHVEMLRRVI